ncbi:MAG: polymer-forming cytoskeletal protein [bacterium]|nr:polymer-forming cytoskeletal protein [bacterium]
MFNPKEEGMMDDAPETIIGQAVRVEGVFSGSGNVTVYGEVVGTFTTSGDLIVEDTAKIEADVEANNITVSGEIHGKIKCHGQLNLLASGKIYGDVQSEVFSVETGAILQGQCVTGNGGGTVEHEEPTEEEVNEE